MSNLLIDAISSARQLLENSDDPQEGFTQVNENWDCARYIENVENTDNKTVTSLSLYEIVDGKTNTSECAWGGRFADLGNVRTSTAYDTSNLNLLSVMPSQMNDDKINITLWAGDTLNYVALTLTHEQIEILRQALLPH